MECLREGHEGLKLGYKVLDQIYELGYWKNKALECFKEYYEE